MEYQCPKCPCCPSRGKPRKDGTNTLCVNCRYGINGHKKMAKSKPKQ